MNNLVDNLVQCIGCGVFDQLFQIVSIIGAAVYRRMGELAVLMLVMFWLFYVAWVFYSFLNSDGNDFKYQDKFKNTLITTIFVSVLLSMGVMFPRMLSVVTFEPVAEITTVYSQILLQITPQEVSERVTYVPLPMRDDGMFRPELRDKIINLMATIVTQFQGMIKLGLAVIVNSFHFTLNPMQILRNIMMFIMGIVLVFVFFKLFIRFCFYFLDIIIELAMFAFLFPFLLAANVLKNSESKWVHGLVSGLGSGQRFQRVVGSIVNLVASVLVYLIVMVVVAKFFQSNAMEANELAGKVLAGTIGYGDLSNENIVNMNLLTFIILGYLLDYMAKRVPEVRDEIFSAFHVTRVDEVGKNIANAVMDSAKGLVDQIVEKGTNTIKAAKGTTT